MDGISPSILERIIREQLEKYQDKFDNLAIEEMTSILAGSYVDAQDKLLKRLKVQGISLSRSYDLDTQRLLRQVIDASISEIRSVPTFYLEQVAEIINEATLRGRDFNFAVKELTEAKIATDHNARLLVRDQVNRAQGQVQIISCQEIGFSEGEWIHIPGTKSSRLTHIAFNGQRFKLSEGLYDSDVDEFVIPNQLRFCNCTFAPVISI